MRTLFPSVSRFLLTLLLVLSSVSADGSISFQYYAVCPGKTLYYFKELPPNEKDGLVLRTVDGYLLRERLEMSSVHPSGGIEILTWSQTDEIWYLEHIDEDGRPLSSVEIHREDFDEMLSGRSTPIFAATSPEKRWIAWVTRTKPEAPQTGYTLRISKLIRNEMDNDSPPLEAQILGGYQEFVTTQISWSPKGPFLYYTDTSKRVLRLNPEDGKRLEVTDGVFCGIVPGTNKILIRRGTNDLVIFDPLTQVKQSVHFPVKLSDKYLYSVYPLPGGERILYVTSRFHLLMENATNLWTANLDGSDLTKIGKSRDSIRDFRFVD